MHSVALHILNGLRIGHRLFLRPQQHLRIGRTEVADVAIPTDAMLSGVHFRVSSHEPESLQVEDLGSRNGTFVNGRPVGFYRAIEGDLITAGTTVFRVSCSV